MTRWIVSAAAAIVLTVTPAAAQDVTFQGLLNEMIDLARLAEFPDPAYTNQQASSYDRNSTDPTVLTDENWFANADRGQHVREEQRNGETEYVLMDAKGPGAIVRIWSANPNDAGVIRFYLDGANEPAIEMSLEELLSGNVFPFISPIGGERARGWNSYLPIPYQTHCKVTSSKPDFYYQINYRTYEAGTTIETYSNGLASQHEDGIRAIASRLKEPAMAGFRDPAMVKETELAPNAVFVQEGQSARPEAITGFICQVDARDMEEALRGLILEISFDDQTRAAIATPLGDFFGTAPGINAYQGGPCGMLEDGTMYARWVMPYRERTFLRVINTTDETVGLKLELTKQPYDWTEDSLYFHATWRGELDIPTKPRQDWTYLGVRGRGRFVGNSLHIVNPVTAWWGEGDEKIYVDGENFPSTFGTGTEDYYGYAWCTPAYFSHPYHNQPRADGPQNYGHVSNNRFHVIDDIPFTESFHFDMEIWHWVETQVSMFSTSYWYGAPGCSALGSTPDPALLVVPEVKQANRIEGAIEGENLRVIDKSDGAVLTQYDFKHGWSNEGQLWWLDGKPGATMRVAVPVDKPGRYEVVARFTESHDYGIAQLYLNGEKVLLPIDFYNPDVTAAAPQSLGVFDLPAGESVLKVEITGKNPNAKPRYMFGLDYLMLDPVN